MSRELTDLSWVSPQHELDEQVYCELLTDGCSILSFSGCAAGPEFSYSVGIYLNFLHPEILLMGLHPTTAHTITSDNGCEFHGYKVIEEKTSVPFYFATPHHSWERGTKENTNGLIRQY